MTVLPNRSTVQDLSSLSDEPPSVEAGAGNDATSPSRYILPKDLDAAIKKLNDQELDRLASAALEERSRRKKLSSSDKQEQRQDAEASADPLPLGKLNAVRAAFKAGVSPARIAREFGLSQSKVRNALSAGHRNNKP